MVNPAALLGLGLAGAVIAVVPALSAKTPTCPDHVVRDESGNGSSVCVAAHSDVTVMLPAAAGTDAKKANDAAARVAEFYSPQSKLA